MAYVEYLCSSGVFGGQYIDQYGKPVDRTPITHPYQYNSFIVYRNGENDEVDHTIYSDHLYKFSHGEDSYEHYNRMTMKHFRDVSQQWHLSDRSPDEIEEFLKDYFNKPNLKLVYMMQGCHQMSGYPIWSFHVHIGD